ncbi:MAG TPA: adenine phosphoribosyltransferase [Longimicrobiales bacterium]|nr:adenine phosphoribosyltransferase [Longimicrobiales bacterium]
MLTDGLAERVRATIRDVPDFPSPGISYKDITPVLADATLMRSITHHFVSLYGGKGIDIVAGIESRGFILGGAVAVALGAGFVPIRKAGKLPHQRLRVEYELEYGADALEAHIDAVTPGMRVLVLDDVLATGGTARAAIDLMRQVGGDVAAAAFLLELQFLHGRSRLQDVAVSSLIGFA